MLVSQEPYWLRSERRRRQRSEQYFTSSQQSDHFLRQLKERWHTGQSLVGKWDLWGRCRLILIRQG